MAGDFSIAVIFIPLDEDRELPVLKSLDLSTTTATTTTTFASLRSFDNDHKMSPSVSLGDDDDDDDVLLDVDTEMKVEDIIEHVVQGILDILKTLK